MTGFEEFQQFRRILCVCPCCGDLVRVSELKLKVKGPATKTWLDEYDNKLRLLEEKEDKFGEMEEELREKAREKGRKQAQKVFNKAICPSFRELKYDPFDIKPILNPVDFVVFKDMNQKDIVNDIVFLSKKLNNDILNLLRKQVKETITDKKYEWMVARIDDKGSIEFE